MGTKSSIQKQVDLALGLSHFSASAVAALVAALASGKPIDQRFIAHLQNLLQTAQSSAPPEASSYFSALRRTLDGEHYEGG